MIDVKPSSLGVTLLLLLSLLLVAPANSILPVSAATSGIVASNYSVSTLANVPVTVNVLAGDSCTTILGLPCAGMYTKSVSQPANGKAVINPDKTVTYTPNSGFTGVDSFTYTASDDLDVYTGTGTVTVTVNPHPTTTKVSPNPASVTAGSSLTFTATVLDSSSSPSTSSGTVSWSDGGGGGSFNPSACSLSSSGSCQVIYASRSTGGTVTVAATYSGDSSHSASSGSASLTVNAPPPPHPTTTTVSPSPASVTVGGKLAFSGTVTDTSTSPSFPSGTLVWSDGGAGGSFSPSSCSSTSVGTNQGQCSTTYSPPATAGSVTITASYSGDSSHASSSGTSVLTISPPPPHPTTTIVTPNPSSVTSGQSIIFTATVSDTGSSPSTPSGTASWGDAGAGGSFAPNTCTLATAGSASNLCSVTYTAPVTASSVTITATYSGDSSHSTSSGTASLTVSAPAPHPTSTAVSPNPATTTVGSQITFAGTVADTSTSPSFPPGTVTWSDGGVGGSFSATACAQTSPSQNQCNVTYTPPSTAGSITITASYSGDSTHAPSSGTSSLAVKNPAPHSTTTKVSPNPGTVAAGGTITLTATVTDSASSPTSPSGTAAWSDGGAGGTFSSTACPLSPGTSSTGSCQVTYTASQTTGSATITSTYSGDASHASSTGTSPLTIASSGTSHLNVNTQSTTGAALAGFYTYLSQGGSGVASGYTPYAFVVNNGQVYAVNVDGYGSCSFSSWLDTGSSNNTRTISITSDTTLTAVLNCGSTTHSSTTGVSPNPASVYTGSTLALTAAVTDTAPTPSPPSGTVSWSDGGAGGTFNPSTCTLSGTSTSNSCSTVYSPPSKIGSETITASYSGDSSHATSSGTSSLAVDGFVKSSSGLLFLDPLNNVTMSQAQLQSQGRYTYGGDAVGEGAHYNYDENVSGHSPGFHIGIQAVAPGKYAGFYALRNFGTGTLYHAVITAPTRTIPSDYINTGIYVQTGNGSVNFVSCGEVTSSFGTYWGVWKATGNSTMSKTSTNLWYDTSANQALTRSCTIVTDGGSHLTAYVDNTLVYTNSALNLQFTRPFMMFLEVQTSYAGQELFGTFTNFYLTTTSGVSVNALPSGASTVKLVQSGTTLASVIVTGSSAILDIGQYTFPLSAQIVVQAADGSTLVSSDVLAWGGDVYTLQ